MELNWKIKIEKFPSIWKLNNTTNQLMANKEFIRENRKHFELNERNTIQQNMENTAEVVFKRNLQHKILILKKKKDLT